MYIQCYEVAYNFVVLTCSVPFSQTQSGYFVISPMSLPRASSNPRSRVWAAQDSVRDQLSNSDTRYIITVSLKLMGCGPLDPHEQSFQEQTLRTILTFFVAFWCSFVKTEGRCKIDVLSVYRTKRVSRIEWLAIFTM